MKARVCFVTSEYPPAVGGLGRSAQRIVRQFARAGLEVHVFTPLQYDARTPVTPPIDGVTVHEVEPRMLRPVKSVRGLTPWLSARPLRFGSRAPQLHAEIMAVDSQLPFDLFHGFGLWVAVACVEAAKNRERPVVLSIRGADGIALPYEPTWITAVARASWVTSVSKDSLERARALANLERRCSFIPNGIESRDSRRWEPAASNRGVVGTVAAFRGKKNLPMLLHAYSMLPRAIRKRLLLVGDFAAKRSASELAAEAFEQEVDRLGLGSEVTLTGFVPNESVPEYLASMRVFAISSDHEGLPNSGIEAAASGVPIVATAVDGLKDIFRDGESALLVPPRDAQAMAGALQRVLNDDELARRLSLGGLEVARKLTAEAEREAYLDLYANLLARPADVARV